MCGAPTAIVSPIAMCSNAIPCAMGTLTSNCTQLKPPLTCAAGLAPAYIGINSVASGGTCAPTLQAPMVQPASWGAHVVGCSFAPVPVSCGSGGTCAPNPSGPNPLKLCIYQDGDKICPAPYAQQKIVIYSGFTDSRSCSACGCGVPQAKCAGGMVTISPNMGCTQGVPNTVPTDCVDDGISPTNPYYAQVTVAPTATGMCQAFGGSSFGSATPTGPTTVCCM
jgi:hypothetical protein